MSIEEMPDTRRCKLSLTSPFVGRRDDEHAHVVLLRGLDARAGAPDGPRARADVAPDEMMVDVAIIESACLNRTRDDVGTAVGAETHEADLALLAVLLHHLPAPTRTKDPVQMLGPVHAVDRKKVQVAALFQLKLPERFFEVGAELGRHRFWWACHHGGWWCVCGVREVGEGERGGSWG